MALAAVARLGDIAGAKYFMARGAGVNATDDVSTALSCENLSMEARHNVTLVSLD